MPQFAVKIFGPQAQLAGVRTLQVEADPNVAAILEALAAASPALAPSLASSRLAVNHGYAAPEDTVKPEDELALIGMISGG